MPGPLDGRGQWFNFKHHTGTAAKRPVIGYLMAVKGKIPQINTFNLNDPTGQRPFQYTLAQRRDKKLREKSQDVNMHRFKSLNLPGRSLRALIRIDGEDHFGHGWDQVFDFFFLDDIDIMLREWA